MPETNQNISHNVRNLGNFLTDAFHYIGLFAIGSMVIWSAAVEFLHVMTNKRAASIEDILLLFIYLELGAMVGIYFKTKRMPVRFLIYVAITALTCTGTADDGPQGSDRTALPPGPRVVRVEVQRERGAPCPTPPHCRKASGRPCRRPASSSSPLTKPCRR